MLASNRLFTGTYQTMTEKAITPRQAVESIAKTTESLMNFVRACRISFDCNRDLMKWATDMRREHGNDVDLGIVGTIREKLDPHAVTMILDAFDESSEICGLATVRLYTALEAGVNDVVIALMEHQGRWVTLPKFQNLKVAASEFVSLSPKEQMKLLLDQVLDKS